MPTKKGKASRRFRPKVMKARQPVLSGIRVPSTEIYSKLLEEYMHPKYKEELLQEAFMNNVQHCVHILMAVRPLNFIFSSYGGFCWRLIGGALTE